MKNDVQTMALGAGCFWCTQAVFDCVRGVLEVEAGYSNGQVLQPSYQQVCSGSSGHNEVVRLHFDANQLALREILEIFFFIHDPTTLNRQGHDVGTQYRSGIYVTQPEQGAVALELIREMNDSGDYRQAIVTEVLPLSNYWAAEDYHQHYFAKNPAQGYCQAVAAPKVAGFRKTFGRLVKP